MTHALRSFTNFAIFFIGSSLILWPILLLFLIVLIAVPVSLYWQSDILLNLEMLVSGVNLPQDDWSLILFVPAFILGLPIIFNHWGGELMESQIELYSYLVSSITTPYGFVGWAFTLVSLFITLYIALKGAKIALNLSTHRSNYFLAILTLIFGCFIFYI